MIEALPPAERAEAVRSMFGDIAPRYDLANSVLSLGFHHLWRRRAIRALAPAPAARVLDLCCGTGDLSFALAAELAEGGEVVGADFCAPMVARASERLQERKDQGPDISFQVGDATRLDFETASFDASTVAFGIRNVVDPVQGLREMARVVRPGGRIAVLEFGQPRGVFGLLFRFYSSVLMPLLGGLITGNRAAYEYLPRTSEAFPAGQAFVDEVLVPAGLSLVQARPMTFGVSWLYLAEVPE